jgi:hypothetical protein
MYRSDDRAVETVFGERQLDRGAGLAQAPSQPLHINRAVLAAGNAHKVLPGFSWTIMRRGLVLDARRPEIQKASFGNKRVNKIRETDRQPCWQRYPIS